MENISFDDFMKLDIRMGRIISAEKVEGADRLLKIQIDSGEEKRTLVAGIAEVYEPDAIVDRYVPVLMNLEPRKIRGIESQGMILAAVSDGRPVLLNPDKDISAGSKIK